MAEPIDGEGYIPVIYRNLLEPIADLVIRMLAADPMSPNEVQAAPRENGYAVSIIVLCLVVLESASNRAQHLTGAVHEVKPPANFLAELGNAELSADVEELFAVRDAIVHNHLWDTRFQWDEAKGMKLTSAPQRLPGYGNSRFERVVDETRRTKRLRLDVFPTRIHRVTSLTVLKKCTEMLRYLESLDRNYVSLGDSKCLKIDGRLWGFYEWVDSLAVST